MVDSVGGTPWGSFSDCKLQQWSLEKGVGLTDRRAKRSSALRGLTSVAKSVTVVDDDNKKLYNEPQA